MAQAWMDSLSEDWVSQPRSSSPRSLPHSSPLSSQRPTQSPNTPRSRIPRLSRLTPGASSSPIRPTPSPRNSNGKNVLTERKSSDMNVRPRSSSAAVTKPALPAPLARSSSTSSIGSVVKHDSVAYRPKGTSSPHKESTPEWKKLAFRNQTGPASQADLFAPIGLEGIFANPSSEDQGSSGGRDIESFSFSEDLQSMPSSPPPWTRNRKSSKDTQNSSGAQLPKSKLSIVQEHEESLPQSSASAPSIRSEGESRPLNSSRPASPNVSSLPEDAVTKLRQNATPQFKLSTASGSSRPGSSVITDGFSPVYISKHNADDGQVAYAAIDPSDPDIQERIRLAQSQSSRGQSQFQEAQQPRTPERTLTNESLQAYQNLSGFVSVKRGGYSDEGSFRRRPLSPSLTSSNLPSESVVPSDSVSQVHLAEHVHHDLTDLPQQTQNASAPQTPVQSKNVDRTKSSVSPLKLFSNHDTYTNKQLLRRMSQMDDLPSSSSPNETAQACQPRRQHDAPLAVEMTDGDRAALSLTHNPYEHFDGDDDLDASLNKREVPMPFKQPSPKRQRTIWEAELQDQLTSAASEKHRQIQTLIGKKRKDALYKSDQPPSEPDKIARRLMLRPRNPTPSQASSAHTRCMSSDGEGDSFLSGIGVPDQTRDRSSSPLPTNVVGAARVRALASEAASYKAHGATDLMASLRKPSVSTQDFYNEAVKIMEMLRARKSLTALAGVEEASTIEHHIEQDLASKRLFTPQTISRPPSREGAPSAWRSRADNVPDPKVMDHLRKFEETGDESFIVASIVRSVKVAQEAAEELDDQEMEPQDMKIRIREGIGAAESTAAQQEPPPGAISNSEKTAGSDQSTDSTGRTINTTSSHRARNLGTIDPSKVSHLIQAETSGMRFDTERQTWVRIKSPRKIITQEAVISSSSAGSDDDPLGQIPDLSVNEEVETMRVNSAGSQSTVVMAGPGSQPPTEQDTNIRESSGSTKGPADGADPLPTETDVSQLAENNFDTEMAAHEEFEASDRPISRTPTGTVQSKRRGPSVLFSSPPVSHLWEARHYKTSSDGEPEEVDAEFSTQQDSSPNLAMYKQPPASFLSKWQDVPAAADDFDSEISFSHVQEHCEISIMEQRPGGRTMSMTLSISTPLPASRSMSRSMLQPTSAVGGCKFMRSLSPMSDFTMHQDDSKHLRSRQLQAGQHVKVRNGTLQSSQAVSTLVEKLTDAEPDEPYWDFMRSLTLRKRSLDTVHGLDEFCPGIEQLDVAGNSLAQLSGIPHGIRSLNAQDNRLTSLTTWGHLSNLQYLDISGNGIDSLDGFKSLVHLREIKADRNKIASLKGVEDLDGLISLSLAENAFEEVDFHGTELKRLTKLDMSSNKLHDIRGLNALPVLRELNIRKNELTLFDGEVSTTQRSDSLQVLDISYNELTGLGVDTFARLQRLCADSNCLVELDGMLGHPSLRTVMLRNQRLEVPSETFEQCIDDFRDLEHLSLSGTRLSPTLNMSRPFHGLRTLDVSFTGLQALPADFATLAPGLQRLNLNANAIKELRPVRGLSRLKSLTATGNRISRMRRVMKMFSGLQELQELDLRNNPVCAGFYGPADDAAKSVVETSEKSLDEEVAEVQMSHLLSPANETLDTQHVARLDEETRLRRRVFELLLGSRSPALKHVNGLPFSEEKIMTKDQVWEQLVEIGIVEKA